jgi:uncharacterized protein YigA (DUF484 family)
MLAQLQMQEQQKKNGKLDAEIQEIVSRAGLNQAKGQGEQVKTKLAPLQLQIQARQTDVSAKTADTQARQVEVDAAKAQIDHHHKTIGHTHERVKNLIALRKANQPAAPAATGA